MKSYFILTKASISSRKEMMKILSPDKKMLLKVLTRVGPLTKIQWKILIKCVVINMTKFVMNRVEIILVYLTTHCHSVSKIQLGYRGILGFPGEIIRTKYTQQRTKQ